MATTALDQQQTIWSDVTVQPSDLVVDKTLPNRIFIINNSNRKVAFKLRTTRQDDVKPEIGVGLLPPNGGKTSFKVEYKDTNNPRPITESDHLTILMHECPEETTVSSSCLALRGGLEGSHERVRDATRS